MKILSRLINFISPPCPTDPNHRQSGHIVTTKYGTKYCWHGDCIEAAMIDVAKHIKEEEELEILQLLDKYIERRNRKKLPDAVNLPIPGFNLDDESANKLLEFIDIYVVKHGAASGKTALYWHLVSVLDRHRVT